MQKPVSLLLIFSLFLFINLSAQKAGQQKDRSLQRPALVVGIVVDQMRWDYLYRYYDRYSDKGFRRMLNEGFSCDNTYIDYIPTVTAIGHATIFTGSIPSIHGITGNDFYARSTGKRIYCTEDSTVFTVGSSSKEGMMSPRNMLVTTVPDELRIATNFRSKVIGIALKDRGSILPAGHTANAAYWFDNLTGNWVSSTYYMKELPAWVIQFNEKKLTEKYLKGNWNTMYKSESYIQSSADDSKYEGRFSGQSSPIFPIETSKMFNGKNYSLIKTTPYGNTITADMAIAAIEHEKLGNNGNTDFLAVSFSSPDYIGHKFGTQALEVEDSYLRLDSTLGEFFDYLDRKVGKGKYIVFLSADHGASHNPYFLAEHNIPSGAWNGEKIRKELNEFLQVKYQVTSLVQHFANYQVHFDNALVSRSGIDGVAMRKDCIDFLSGKEGIAYVVDLDHIGNASIPAELKLRMINGYHQDRSGAIQIILKPGWMPNSGTGTGHGTWNVNDAHIPLLFMGWGIKKGKTSRRTNMTDIAPTLSALLRIQEPNGNIGEPILEALKMD